MKKIISLLLICLLLLAAAGCGEVPDSSDKLQIVCTVFPQYDWVRNIIGENAENVELTLLMDNGADLHNYQSTVSDLMSISTCDLFIHVGGESDDWVEDALKNPTNENRKVLALMDVVELLEYEHEEDHEHEEGEEHEHEYDEHIWLSLKNADKAVEELADLLAELDPDHAEDYRSNAAAYRASLQALDSKYQQCADSAVRKAMLFADRFPFRYLAEDYGLEYYAAFIGCSAEVEVSFSTMAHLIETVDAENLPYVMVTETGDQKLAKTVISKTKTKNQDILVADSMQSVTQARIDAGETYLSIMEQNLSVFNAALH